MVRGREAIVADWLEHRDPPGSWEASYRPLLVEGERAIATGTTAYSDGRYYWNLWVLGFEPGGRCTGFVQWYMTRPPR